MEFLTAIAVATVDIFREAAPYVLFGFLAAGVLHVYLKPSMVLRFFKKRNLRSVVYASLLGIPIPL